MRAGKDPLLRWKPTGLAARLFVFFLLLIVTMGAGTVGFLTMTGFFSAKTEEHRKAIASELAQTSQKMEKQFGDISIQALRLARHLSESIERRLAEKKLSTDDLRVQPGLLEEILNGEYEPLFFALERAKTSGAFLVLNATASRRAQEARVFRAGFFFKNWEPNTLSMSSAILYLRGISRIGQKHGMVLDAQWAMEFDIEDEPYYNLPQKAVRENPAFLPRLYYWQSALPLKGTDYRGMLCSAPLVDSRGNTFGVCGFEVDDAFFKFSYMPANSDYNNIFCVLAPMSKRTLDVSHALFSWRYTTAVGPRLGREMEISAPKKNFSTYVQDNGEVFVGLHVQINLYAQDSPFAADKYALALLVPEAEFDALSAAGNRGLMSFLLLLLGVGIALSFTLSKWYTRPILKGFDTIRNVYGQEPGGEVFSSDIRVNIPEIDDLMEFLFSQSESMSAKTQGALAPNPETRGLFSKDAETLTTTEKNVLDLYLEGRSAKEIAEILNLSVNTIKTHNRHIFIKLNVSSRNELLALAREMRKHKS